MIFWVYHYENIYRIEKRKRGFFCSQMQMLEVSDPSSLHKKGPSTKTLSHKLLN